MKRISIKDLARETGLSRATIDRALNGRGGVHPRTHRVIEETMQRLNAAPKMVRDGGEDLAVDFALRLGRGKLAQIVDALGRLDAPSSLVHDMAARDDEAMLDLVRELCRDATRPLVLCAKNAEPLRAELIAARRRGKVVVTLISDLPRDARDAFVGIDDRMAGQTAAFVLGRVLGHRPAKVGIVLGDYAFTCHEDREIGFRSHLRAHFPSVAVADVAKGEDSFEQTYVAVRDLLAAHPDLDAIYNVAGGNAGLARAAEEAGRARDLVVLAHEVNHITVPLIRAGAVDYLLSQDTLGMVELALRLAREAKDGPVRDLNQLDFGVYTPFNLPADQFAPEAVTEAARAAAPEPLAYG